MTKLERQFIIVIVVVAAILAARMALKSSIASIRKDLAEKNPERDTSQLAVRFREAFDPYFWGMGTDEDALFQLAYESRGIFKEVAKNYKGRYGDTLDQDLSENLGSEDLAKFYQILNG